MAAKRKCVDVNMEESNSSRSEETDESMSEDEMINKEIQVDFEALTPCDDDFLGMKSLLQQLFLKAHVDLSELTSILIKQNYVCSIVKQNPGDDISSGDDDDDGGGIFAVTSVVNITDKKDLNCIKQIYNLLIDHCKHAGAEEEEQKLKMILDNPQKHVGLILSERIINIPPQIALPLYGNLRSDMQQALEKKMPYDFSYFLLISKILKPCKQKKKTGGKKSLNNSSDSIIFSNAEEEFFSEEADFQFDYSVAGELDTALVGKWTDDDDEWKPYRRVLVINASKLDSIIQKLQAVLS